MTAISLIERHKHSRLMQDWLSQPVAAASCQNLTIDPAYFGRFGRPWSRPPEGMS
jgi:hypothetical protein